MCVRTCIYNMHVHVLLYVQVGVLMCVQCLHEVHTLRTLYAAHVLTVGPLQCNSMLTAPSNGMDVLETWFTLVVVVIPPAIKMDGQPSLTYTRDGCHTDEVRVLQVFCFKFTVDTETTNSLLVTTDSCLVITNNHLVLALSAS